MIIKRIVKIIIIIVLIGWLNENVLAQCDCRVAKEKEVGYGANELIEMKDRVRKKLFGTVKYDAYEDIVIEKAVIEVFKIKDLSEESYAVANTSKREVACITGKDGKYCFPELPAGLYVVRVGTLGKREGLNYLFIKVKIDPYLLKKDKPIIFTLSVGT